MNQRLPNIIDIEASGFGSHSYPIEVGVALGSGEKYCSLVLPPIDWVHWDENAVAVHGISRSILETYGNPIEEIAHKLNELLRDDVAYSDGWEVDNPWLWKLFYNAGIPKLFRFSTLEMILSQGQMAQWHEVKEEVIDTLDYVRHRASQDAVIIQETYAQTLET